jgi:Raf kinase inhibitor-like YbhB/YbcL family protein
VSPLGTGTAALAAAFLAGCGASQAPSAQGSDAARQAGSMKLAGPAFAGGQTIPAEFTCDGAGRSPPLQWSEPPNGTQGFALVVEDPDAPGGTFRHWGVYDLPMSARQLDTGAAESGASGLKQTKNDFGEAGYGPPCPPKGDPAHHYHFRLMALDVPRLPGAPSRVKDILRAGSGHVLGSAELVALYGR